MEEKNYQVAQQQQQKTSKLPLVLGIIAMIAWLIPILGLGVSIGGIISSIGKMKSENSKISKIGLILCIIGVVASLLNWIIGTMIIMNKLL